MLRQNQKKCISLLWKGYKVHQIAAMLGVHRTTIWRWFQREEMRRYAERYFDTALRREMNKATLHIFDDLDNPNPWKAQQTAIKVLDAVSFAGLSATE